MCVLDVCVSGACAVCECRVRVCRRVQIKEGMGFALDHADNAHEVVTMISASLQKSVTPAPVKVARLYLVSDILHNSSAPVRNASTYRSEFQECLPDIFESLYRCFSSITGRITAELMKEKVCACVPTVVCYR
jgi:U2-associated protein SR140